MDGGLWNCTRCSDQEHPQGGEKCKKAKWLPEEALQIAEKRREAEGKEEKEICRSECIVPKNSKDR